MRRICSVARSMRAVSAFLFIAAAAQVVVPTALASQEAPGAVSSKLVEGSGGLSTLWTEGARLPIIVEFAMPPIPDPASFGSPADADAAHTQAIRAVQDAILIDLLGSPADVSNAEASTDTNLKRMAFSPMFGIVATAGDVERLAADTRVVRIHEDGLSDPSLIESVPLIGMPTAYSMGATGYRFRVAVLDTGGRRSHEFLGEKIESEACYSTTNAQSKSESMCPGGVSESTSFGSANDCDAETIFGCSHGTHVAGTAAGFNTNQQAGEPAHGVARHGGIVSINVFSRFPVSACGSIPAQYTGGCVRSFDTDQIKGLERVYALRMEYDPGGEPLWIAAANMSLGGGQFFSACDSDARKPIIDLLRASYIATVIAAGNDGFDTSVSAPACISTAITVASSSKQDVRSSFSNWGTMIDMVAPGTDILASHVSGDSDTSYSSLSGTSMAAAHIAGAFAAIRSRVWVGQGNFTTVTEIESALKSTGLNIASAGTTKPRVRVPQALVALGIELPRPANDNFTNRLNIPLPATVIGTNIRATSETGEPVHAGVSTALNSVWWRFTPSASGPVTINTFGSNFDTVLAVYTGSSVANLAPVASNDDFNGSQSQVSFQGTAGISYAIAVAGKANAEGSISLTVDAPVLPANDRFANRINIPNPATVTGTNIWATAEAGEPIHAGVSTARNSVWWRYTPSASGQVTINTFGSNFDTVLAVYTGSSVANLSPVASNDNFGGTPQSQVSFLAMADTSYAIAVAGKDNASGSITLTLALTPPPANDNFANRIDIPNPAAVTGTNIGATPEAGEPIHAGSTSARNSVWWRFTPSASGPVTIDTFGSDFDTVLAVYTGSSVANLTPVASNDDSGGTQQSRVSLQGAAGTSYAIAVAGFALSEGNILLTVQAGSGGNTTTIVSAVTPVTRATQVGSTVTAFASVINAGPVSATSCSVALPGSPPVTFSYRSRNHNTGTLGTVNQPVNIAAGARQDFLMAFTPTGAMQQELALVFDCTNTPPAPSVVGLNTFLLIGTTSAPPADMLSIAETSTGDGIMNIPLGGTGFAALAAMNIGASAQIQARLSASSILSSPTQLPNTTVMVICRTNPTTGACLATPTATVNFTPGANEIVTFTAFVASNGTPIPFNPASTRLFVHFFQGTTPVGSASVAARTVPSGDEGPGETAAMVD